MAVRPKGLLGKLYDSAAGKETNPAESIKAFAEQAWTEGVIQRTTFNYLSDRFGFEGPQLTKAEAITKRSTVTVTEPVYSLDEVVQEFDEESGTRYDSHLVTGYVDKEVPVFGVEERVNTLERRAYDALSGYIRLHRPVSNPRTRVIADLPWSKPKAKTGGQARERVIRLLEASGKPQTVAGLISLFTEASRTGYFEPPVGSGFGPRILSMTYQTLAAVDVALPAINLMRTYK